ncbi:hypothetical protein HX804_01665 [Marine Group I thaumarchaeote]|uniref:Uncharacterized protein n=1 Tax=Marine Group I thaumarchaeote TaxID=2511932 RepID=A0A7K4NN20_9ARCH|nr:hypothetical protein [Marine Group I thaumarchaeote]
MAQTKNIVKKFIDSPYQITGFETWYKKFVALLHLLLVLHEEKKCFVCLNTLDELDNVLKICKELEFKPGNWKKVDAQINDKIPGTIKMGKEMAECIVKRGSNDFHGVICSMDRASLAEIASIDHKKIAEFEEYPGCCVDAFIENRWEYYEIMVSALGKPVAQSRALAPDYEEKIRQWADSVCVPVKLAIDADFAVNGGYLVENAIVEDVEDLKRQISQDMAAYYKKQYGIKSNTIKKYHFVSHHACEGCLSDVKNSPTAKMNKQYSGFCKREYPELHDRIIAEAKNAADEAAQGNGL